MKVLLVSHSSVVDVYQDKLRYLGGRADLDMNLLIPSVYKEGSRPVRGFDGSGEYRVHKRPALFGRYGRQNMHLYLNLSSVFARVQPDILHIEEEPSSLVSWQLIRAATRLKRQPRIVLFTWQNLVYDYGSFHPLKPQRYIQPRVERRVLDRLDHLIAGNSEAMDIFSAKGCRAPMTLIPQYGVDPVKFRPLDSGSALANELGLRGPVIGYVGRMLAMKGIDVLIAAAARLKDKNWSMLLLGSGPDKAGFMSQAQELGLAGRVNWIESVPAARVAEYMNCMDVMVLPSRGTKVWKEQFGRVLTEAMACQVPVLGSSSGEIPNVIGEGGLVFEEENAEDLAAQLAVLIDDADQRRRLGFAGRDRVMKHYTNERIAAKIYDVYTALRKS